MSPGVFLALLGKTCSTGNNIILFPINTQLQIEDTQGFFFFFYTVWACPCTRFSPVGLDREQHPILSVTGRINLLLLLFTNPQLLLLHWRDKVGGYYQTTSELSISLS